MYLEGIVFGIYGIVFVSFSPGSVQAEIQIEVANPNVSIVRNVVAVIDDLGNFSLNRNLTKVQSEPGKKIHCLRTIL